MTIGPYLFSSGRRPAVAIVLLFSAVASAHAGPDFSQRVRIGATLVPKDGLALLPTEIPGAKGSFYTKFVFNPTQEFETNLTKNFNTNKVSPASQTDVYTLMDANGTTGEAEHSLKIQTVKVPVGPKEVETKLLTDFIKGTIAPGNAPPGKASIMAATNDPIGFSDTSSNAAFYYKSSGLEVPLSLGSGTAFPQLWADPTDPFSPGADADDTSMSVTVRIAPGVISDPATFWGATPPTGAVNLYTLTLTSDENYDVTATITPGASDADFTLDLGDVGAAESTIETAFDGTHGILETDLNYVFDAGFVPNPALTAYTVGVQVEEAMTVNLVAVPEPDSAALLLVGAVPLFIVRWRSRLKAARVA
jgi:hypothetical protein